MVTVKDTDTDVFVALANDDVRSASEFAHLPIVLCLLMIWDLYNIMNIFIFEVVSNECHHSYVAFLF